MEVKERGNTWEVHKFGGSSLRRGELFSKVSEILNKAKSPKKASVVSAIYGVTDSLSLAVNKAKNGLGIGDSIKSLRKKHFDVIDELFEEEAPKQELKSILEQDFTGLLHLLKTVEMSSYASETLMEIIMGHGEIWSAQILNKLLLSQNKKSQWLNAREVLFLKDNSPDREVDWDLSWNKLQKKLKGFDDQFLIITGFVASTVKGIPTTLKRNGSDISATIFGQLLQAKEVSIWSDVDGIMSADPRYVPGAKPIKEVSYSEAMEMAYFGAKILHPKTLAPIIDKKIPLRIKNTFNPEAPGTLIGEKKIQKKIYKDKYTLKTSIVGLSNVDSLSVINIEGTNLVGIPRLVGRVFGALQGELINVFLISQASSEHSICFCVPYNDRILTKNILEKELYRELKENFIHTITTSDPSSILAVVGENMIQTPGVASRFFGALGKANINVRAIAQGSSERNISAVISQKEVKRAIKAVHAGFYLSPQTLSIGLIGPGLIGKAILKQLQEQKNNLKIDFDFDFRIRGICNSKKMLLSNDEIDLTQWIDEFNEKAINQNLNDFVDFLHTDDFPHTCLIDCTASNELASFYPSWLSKGIHIITPNKKGNSGDFSLYQEIQRSVNKKKSYYFYEATVGAGLPLISTLKEIIQTGDEVIEIEGVFSGTLSYIFNQFGESSPFSKVVIDAKEKGYTEPDPREDLSGLDVARKAIILAREMGHKIGLEDVQVEDCIPQFLKGDLTLNEFMQNLKKGDQVFEEQRLRAFKKGELLRYGAKINSKGEIFVSLRGYPKEHPFCQIKDSDNIVLFKTKRYNKRPLIIQGPGAGPEVTAGGIFSDLIRLTNSLGKD